MKTQTTLEPVCRDGDGQRALVLAKGFLSSRDEPVEDWRVALRATGWTGEIWRVCWDGTGARKLHHLLQPSMFAKAYGASLIGPRGFGPTSLLMGAVNDIEEAFHRARQEAATVAKQHLPTLISDMPHREISLIGHSLGGFLMFTLLQTLAARNETRIRDAVIVAGALASQPSSSWEQARSVCSGAIYNAYHTEDAVLRLLYSLAQSGEIASGTTAIASSAVRNLCGDGVLSAPSMWNRGLWWGGLAPLVIWAADAIKSHTGWVDAMPRVAERLPWHSM